MVELTCMGCGPLPWMSLPLSPAFCACCQVEDTCPGLIHPQSHRERMVSKYGPGLSPVTLQPIRYSSDSLWPALQYIVLAVPPKKRSCAVHGQRVDTTRWKLIIVNRSEVEVQKSYISQPRLYSAQDHHQRQVDKACFSLTPLQGLVFMDTEYSTLETRPDSTKVKFCRIKNLNWLCRPSSQASRAACLRGEGMRKRAIEFGDSHLKSKVTWTCALACRVSICGCGPGCWRTVLAPSDLLQHF